jgi:uncharacterized protein
MNNRRNRRTEFIPFPPSRRNRRTEFIPFPLAFSHRTEFIRFLVSFSLLFLSAAIPARAQFEGMMSAPAATNIEGFTVAGKAQLASKPDVVEIDLEVSAASELTADAIVKYRDAKKRIRDAFAALKLDNISVDERGLQVDRKGTMQSPYYWDSQPNTRTKTEVQLTRKLVVKASGIRKMDEEAVLQLVGRLLDVAQDAGAKVGPDNNNNYYYWRWGMNQGSGLARFVLEDFDKLQEEAYAKAVTDARARAERLARLSKVELGSVVAIREVAVPGDKPNSMMGDMPQTNTPDESTKKRLETSKFQDVPVKVELLVRFEVHPALDRAREKRKELQ